jgi:nucleoside-diphosphate-sugar epimerase
MPGAAERLKLFKADLLQPGAFEEAVAGCDVVIHTASPYLIKVPKGGPAFLQHNDQTCNSRAWAIKPRFNSLE